jgi:hypothetical protein
MGYARNAYGNSWDDDGTGVVGACRGHSNWRKYLPFDQQASSYLRVSFSGHGANY